MSSKSLWRGHKIEFINGKWCYTDIGVRVFDDSDRPCTRCGQKSTPEGHDACIGTLPGVMNACCGHGEILYAYMQLIGGEYVYGQDAVDAFEKLP